jgi:hypothetical protein
MSERTERQRLLLEASDLPRGISELPGRIGHSATLEPSAHGGARIIHVSRDGVEVCWAFSLEAGEARPQFYPADIPFVGELSAVLVWDVDTGLHVKWMVPGYMKRIRELRDRVGDLDEAAIPKEVTVMAERMKEASPAERKERFAELNVEEGSPVLAWAKDVFGESAQGLPEEATRGVEEIITFHEDAGWEVAEGESGSNHRHVEMKKGSAIRRLAAISIMGLTTIALSQPLGQATTLE